MEGPPKVPSHSAGTLTQTIRSSYAFHAHSSIRPVPALFTPPAPFPNFILPRYSALRTRLFSPGHVCEIRRNFRQILNPNFRLHRFSIISTNLELSVNAAGCDFLEAHGSRRTRCRSAGSFDRAGSGTRSMMDLRKGKTYQRV
jgi:hypothetical protein